MHLNTPRAGVVSLSENRMRTSAQFLFAATAVVVFLLAFSAVPHSRTPLRVTWLVPFEPFAVKVVERETQEALAGVLIKPACLGGSSYGERTYLTDSTGSAKPFYPRGAVLLFSRFEKVGFRPAFVAVERAPSILSLSRFRR